MNLHYTSGILQVLSSCKSWMKGEQDIRACRVAFRKHKFPKLIKPLGSKFLTVTLGPFDAVKVFSLESTRSKISDELTEASVARGSDDIFTSSVAFCFGLHWFGGSQTLPDKHDTDSIGDFISFRLLTALFPLTGLQHSSSLGLVLNMPTDLRVAESSEPNLISMSFSVGCVCRDLISWSVNEPNTNICQW